MEDQIIEFMDSPSAMEQLYRADSGEFNRSFPKVFAGHPESVILQVWNERLLAEVEHVKNRVAAAWSWKNLLFVIGLCALAGTIFKLPDFISSLEYGDFTLKNLSLVFILPLIFYYLQRTRAYKTGAFAIILAAAILVFLNFLPNCTCGHDSNISRVFSDAISSATMHAPIFLLLMTGLVFTGSKWRSRSDWMGFLRYLGELIVFTAILLLAVGLLTAITTMLLTFIDQYAIEEWYTSNIMVYLLVSTPILATFLIDRVIDRRQNIAPAIARIFTPLFLITVLGYIIVLIVNQVNPFGDRDFLIALNLLMVVVLGLLIFTISERDPDSKVGVSDYLNIALAVAVILMDGTALSATIYRTVSDIHGLTPNRITVLGLNLLVFVHIIGILFNYIHFVWRKTGFEKLAGWITGFLPAYMVWSLLVSFGLPLLYWYR